MPIEQKQEVKDSVVALVDKGTMARNVPVKEDSVARVKITDTSSDKKTKNKVTINPKKQEKRQTITAKIWSEEQIAFLNKVEKILLFNIKVTEIGSRKLELDSQLDETEHKTFVQVLLHPESYTDTGLVESSNGKKFEPSYQMLLEAGDEKLTLMFDAKGLHMMVANLYGREKYAIASSLLKQVENLRKKE